ncbi:2-hydroxychromene-2-carboxylate isomerase [Roseibium sp. MMSF_3544]|uniref:2-hydroxychromene-2-carboxylate isomerase n=1 Tax=unclassified Roseibium TaxID=2629323 RepID=UPI00273E6D4D|nr:2-hydroxychromene-2-carboxylate isomerase [Roseibium sp. MMSF_3544]
MAVIEYVYSAHSAFAYLGSAEIQRICADHGVVLVHRPILLSPVVEAQRSPAFRKRTQQHVDYFFGREIERWAEFRSVPIINHRPSQHDADYSIASGMIIALGETGPQTDRMAHRLMDAHWREDVDLSDEIALKAIARELGLDPETHLTKAASREVQDTLQANTQWAVSKALFGSPTYVVDGDPFYGQDHLPLVERALKTPFKPSDWSNPSVD